jgi:histidyl-tRNA synthetase
MKTIIQGVKGARDFYPEDMAYRSWLYRHIGEISSSYGYQEYDAAFLEKVDLYAAKSGDELVKEQSFVFPDRGGDLITLRPELTPSLARMIAQRQNELVFPVRWWSYGPFWRYEKPQKGRSREFFQWNCDLIGPNSSEADAELISIAASFLKRVGLKGNQVHIRVNHRKLMESQILAMGVSAENIKQVFKVIDRREKLHREVWRQFAEEMGLNSEQTDRLEALIGNLDLWKESPELVRIFEILHATGLADYIRFDPSVIRGLDYYTGVVFEARDEDGEFRAILGGGRYNNLVGDVGGQPVGGLGFAMGDMVIRLALQKYGCLPEFNLFPARVMVTIFDETSAIKSVLITDALRKEGISASCYPEVAKLPKQFKYADRAGVRFMVVLGPDEQAEGKVTVKDLESGTQEMVAEADLAGYFSAKLA